LLTAVPFPGVLGGSPEYLPHGRSQVRDRHLKFHETRDNLLAHAGTVAGDAVLVRDSKNRAHGPTSP
jgi:hypothetical protein